MAFIGKNPLSRKVEFLRLNDRVIEFVLDKYKGRN